MSQSSFDCDRAMLSIRVGLQQLSKKVPSASTKAKSARSLAKAPRAASLAKSWYSTGSKGIRVEKDTFGDINVPADRYWGAQTQRYVAFEIRSCKTVLLWRQVERVVFELRWNRWLTVSVM